MIIAGEIILHYLYLYVLVRMELRSTMISNTFGPGYVTALL